MKMGLAADGRGGRSTLPMAVVLYKESIFNLRGDVFVFNNFPLIIPLPYISSNSLFLNLCSSSDDNGAERKRDNRNIKVISISSTLPNCLPNLLRIDFATNCTKCEKFSRQRSKFVYGMNIVLSISQYVLHKNIPGDVRVPVRVTHSPNMEKCIRLFVLANLKAIWKLSVSTFSITFKNHLSILRTKICLDSSYSFCRIFTRRWG